MYLLLSHRTCLSPRVGGRRPNALWLALPNDANKSCASGQVVGLGDGANANRNHHPAAGNAAVAGVIVGENVWGRGRDGIIPGMGLRPAGEAFFFFSPSIGV